jgi:phenylacetate-CoA ligase
MVRFHGIFVGQPNIIEGQIIQEAIDHIHVKIVPTANFSQEDVNNIVARVQARMGASIGVTVETVTSIPRTSAGKFKAVISKING